MLRPPPPETCSQKQKQWQEPLQEVVAAFSTTICDMLQMKYGLSLEATDFCRKVGALYKDAHPERAAPENSNAADHLMDLVMRFNEQKDLRFRVQDGGALVTLRAEFHCVDTYDELRREVRRMPGTARALAVISGNCNEGPQTPRGTNSLRCVAVFRESYVKPDILVSHGSGATQPLVSIRGSDVRAAIILDPEVTGVLRSADGCKNLIEEPAPQMREEYASLGAWLLPDEAVRLPPPETPPVHVAARPWANVVAEVAESAAVPNHSWMLRLRCALEHPDARGDELLAHLRQLTTWLAGTCGKETQTGANETLLAAGAHHGLVGLVKRASDRNCDGGADLLISTQACRVIELSLASSSMGRIPFAFEGIVPVLCGIMNRWPDRVEVQRAAASALSQMLVEDGCAVEALRCDLPQILNAAISAHPGIADLQTNSARAMKRMAQQTEEWSRYRDACSRGLTSSHSPPPVSLPLSPAQTTYGTAGFLQMSTPCLTGCATPPSAMSTASSHATAPARNTLYPPPLLPSPNLTPPCLPPLHLLALTERSCMSSLPMSAAAPYQGIPLYAAM